MKNYKETFVAGTPIGCFRTGTEDKELGGHGGARERGVQVRNTNMKPQTQDTSYNLARLKRDRPELAERVIAGELSLKAIRVCRDCNRSLLAPRPDTVRCLACRIQRYTESLDGRGIALCARAANDACA